jgi:hypothetical protein
MSYYSFKVKSSEEVVIPSRALAIGEGVDVFSKVIDDLPGFLAELQKLGVQVLECHQLDKLEAIQPDLAMIADSTEGPMLLSSGEQHPSTAEE